MKQVLLDVFSFSDVGVDTPNNSKGLKKNAQFISEF